ncbi:glutamate racemase [Flagellimonas allohymeniacidonis]|uniref:Glutamate racemase n=1 Tax=Flagellimonas allohymeniacidonis TaxID=2517819 RepID=A0A4Q8QF79_9FLAO|nr:glutamate racemase [Allomuricauda hymeniacidonis]TAI46969.1 glutamate racemase [Allomuricauda hymeniacidonis]
MQKPVGIFDSGVGGTSIWKEIRKKMPYEDTIYLADSKNAPYGAKPSEEILQLSIKNVELLLEKNCKIIVVACNTATTNAIEYLRKTYEVPFIGIEPAIKPAALHTQTKKVGVLATKGTLSSSLFHSTSKMYAEGITVMEQEGKGLVELIEQGKQASDEVRKLLIQYLAPMLEVGIDCLVLGCTHYPYLIPMLTEILPKNVHIIDSGEAVARQTHAVLEKLQLLTKSETLGTSKFFSNSNIEVLKNLVGNQTEVAKLDF